MNKAKRDCIAVLIILFFIGWADGLMDALGIFWFMAVGVAVMAVCWALVCWEAV